MHEAGRVNLLKFTGRVSLVLSPPENIKKHEKTLVFWWFQEKNLIHLILLKYQVIFGDDPLDIPNKRLCIKVMISLFQSMKVVNL